MNTTIKKDEVQIPNILWKKIKMYMLGQDYWKKKMSLCFDIPYIGYYRAYDYDKGVYTSIKSRRPMRCLLVEKVNQIIKKYYMVPYKNQLVIETEMADDNVFYNNDYEILYWDKVNWFKYVDGNH